MLKITLRFLLASAGALAIVTVTAVPAGGKPAPQATQIERDGSFLFQWTGPAYEVFYHLPPLVTRDTPIVFVMHGAGRNGAAYRKSWSGLADANGFIVVAPQFDLKTFPGGFTYAFGGVVDEHGKPLPREKWTYASIELLFDEMRRRTGSAVPTYSIYGHSAGGQFVHRFVMLMPKLRLKVAVAANPGAYAMPSYGVQYPFGLKGTPADDAQMRRALARPLVILLGTADVDPNSGSLPRQPDAMIQGPHRLARGQAFYGVAKEMAKKLATPFAWKLGYAKGIGHSNAGMSRYALPYLGEGYVPAKPGEKLAEKADVE